MNHYLKCLKSKMGQKTVRMEINRQNGSETKKVVLELSLCKQKNPSDSIRNQQNPLKSVRVMRLN